MSMNPQEHKSKYIFLLAYASSVCDSWSMKKGNRKTLNKDEVKGTMQALEKVHSICSANKGQCDCCCCHSYCYCCCCCQGYSYFYCCCCYFIIVVGHYVCLANKGEVFCWLLLLFLLMLFLMLLLLLLLTSSALPTRAGMGFFLFLRKLF